VAAKCWDGDDFNTDPSILAAWLSTGTASVENATAGWIYSGFGFRMKDGHSYTLVSRASDNSSPQNVESNFQIAVNSVTFVYDVSKPTSVVTYPSANGTYTLATLATISGTMLDLTPSGGGQVSGVGYVYVSVEDLSQGTTWWNDTTHAWANSEQWNTATLYQTSWSYTLTQLPWQSGRQYRVRSKAIDNSVPGGNDQDAAYP
jgi:hypothetical protein